MTEVNNNEEPKLGVEDIRNAIKCIDYACDQGAFKGWATIGQVGSVRQTLDRFVTFIDAQNAKETPEKEGAQ